MRVKDALGRFGEDLAVERLEAAGMVVLDRNWRCAERELPGEIDVVRTTPSVLSCRNPSMIVRTAFLVPAYTACVGTILRPEVETTVTR